MLTDTKLGWQEGQTLSTTEEHVAAMERILPEIARRLFTLIDSPIEELPSAQRKVCFLLLDGRRTVSQIAEELRISVSAATQVADRLEKVEMVERVSETLADGGDRRHRYVQLTERATVLLKERREHRQARVAEMLERIPPARHVAIRQALETMLAACREL